MDVEIPKETPNEPVSRDTEQEVKVSSDTLVEPNAPISNNTTRNGGDNEKETESVGAEPQRTSLKMEVESTVETGDGSGGEEKMDSAAHEDSQESQNGEGTPAQKKRNRSRDDLSLSPDMTKTGKRQRKTNSLYSGFSIDKKTSHILETEQVFTSVEVSSIAVASTSTDPSSLGRKEVLLTALDAQVKAKRLPKGYAYEPVIGPVVSSDTLPAKRERKKQPGSAVKPNKKQKHSNVSGGGSSKPSKKHSNPKKHSSPVASAPSAPPPDEVTAQMIKKQELEHQLSALTQQLAMVSQTLETKTKQVQALEKMEKPEVAKEDKTDSPDESGDVEIALPSGTIIRQKKRQPVAKKAKRNQSVYDRFESDDDLPVAKKAGKRSSGKSKDSGVRPQRSTKKKSLANIDEDSEEESFPPPASHTALKNESAEDFQVEEYLKGCLKVLLSLRRHHYAWPFNVPVDPVALHLPDYLDIIKQPMDFGTVLEKLKATKYATVDEFGEDVRLIFKNAMTYNQPGSDICIMANTLGNNFEKQFSKLGGKPAHRAPSPLPKTPVLSEAPTAEAEGPTSTLAEDPSVKTKAEMANTINELRDSMKYVRQEISKLRKEKASSPAAPRARAPQRPKEEPLREMTFEEKRQLSVNINQLQPENLGKVVQIIHQRMPNLAQNSPDEIEIDIDALDTSTLRALEKYVKQCLAKKKGKRNAPMSTYLQAEQTAQNTSKSIQDVKKKLKELSDKAPTGEKKPKKRKEEDTEDVDIDDDAPARTYPSVEIPKDKDSSSSSSSDSSSSSSDSSSSESEEEKKQEAPLAPGAPAANNVTTLHPPSTTNDVAEKPEQDQKDAILPSPERETATPMDVAAKQPEDTPEKSVDAESPQILPAAVKKEVELKNLDSWANLGMDSAADSTETKKKDETWSQFQNRDLQNKQREREREEQQEKEKRDRIEREAERRRQDEQRAKELAEQEQKKQYEEEESKLAAQRELAAKRAAERKAREQLSANSINMLDQSVIMSSFEMGVSGAPEALLKLKEQDQREEGEM